MRSHFVTSALLVLLVGCAPLGTYFYINVDGINDPAAPSMKRYFLFPANPGVTPEDLYFREYSSYIRQALDSNGFIQSSLDSAEIVVAIQYGIGAPQTQSYTYSVPIYGRTDPGTTTISSTTYGSTGTSTTYGSITPKRRYGVIGTQTYSGTQTSFVRYLTLTAIDLSVFRRDSSARVVWNTSIVSEGSSNDLRYVMPALVAGSSKYFGMNTGKTLNLSIREDDPALLKFRKPESVQ